MASKAQARRRVKPVRTVRVALGPSEANPFYVLVITERTKRTVKATTYTVTRIPAPMGGEGFRISKWGASLEKAEEYQVCLDREGSYCCCMSFCRWGACRHISGLAALRDAGKI